MRFSIVVFFTASLTSAFTIIKRQDAPACAQSCWGAANHNPCPADDLPCYCVNSNFLTEFDICTENTCTPAEVDTANTWNQATCQQAGVNLEDPYPACAQPCLQNTPLPAACTDGDDLCLCKDATYTQTLSSCISSSCTGQDLTNANTVDQAYCRAATAPDTTAATA